MVLPITLFRTTLVGQSMALSYHTAWPESTHINIFRITWLGRTALPTTLLLIPHGSAGLYSLSNFPVPHGLAGGYSHPTFSYHMARPGGTPINNFLYHTGWPKYTSPHTTRSAGIYSYCTCSYHTAQPKGLPSHFFVPHSSAGLYSQSHFPIPHGLAKVYFSSCLIPGHYRDNHPPPF
jgi:hypothetical protein